MKHTNGHNLPTADRMRIVDVVWTTDVNMLRVECVCGNRFIHRSNWIRIVCHRCGLMNVWHEWPKGNLPQAIVALSQAAHAPASTRGGRTR